MFLILSTANLIADISLHIQYVRVQSNGIVAGCDAAIADAIYSATTDQFYLLRTSIYASAGYRAVKVDTVPEHVIAGYYSYADDGTYYITPDKQAELDRAAALKSAVTEVGRLSAVSTEVDAALVEQYETQVAQDASIIELYEMIGGQTK